MSDNKTLLVFENTRSVILAERECIKAGFKCTAVPTPREYTSSCGIALEIPPEQKDDVLKFLKEQGRPFKYFDKNDPDLHNSSGQCKI